MVTHMKTTVDISDDLMLRAKQAAVTSGTSVRRLIEQGLREVLARHGAEPTKRVNPVTFRGNGLRAEFRGRGWDAVRDAIYEERG